ncbi:hypothetical protein vBCtySFA70_00064 [Clostridium phage vB_CtyS-FA70]|nr:hypothetical protein vBCtySFA70_00064 [Clostridium phage vB_CtyS-FA70]
MGKRKRMDTTIIDDTFLGRLAKPRMGYFEGLTGTIKKFGGDYVLEFPFGAKLAVYRTTELIFVGGR